jgi:hypothetical protein
MRILKVEMIGNTGKAIELGNTCEISFSVILPDGLNIPGNQGFIYLPGNTRRFYQFVILSTYSDI